MKRILTLGIVLLTANSLLPAQEITFSETKFDWGTVQEQDGTVSHDFRFVNTGDKPLTIKISLPVADAPRPNGLKKPINPVRKEPYGWYIIRKAERKTASTSLPKYIPTELPKEWLPWKWQER